MWGPAAGRCRVDAPGAPGVDRGEAEVLMDAWNAAAYVYPWDVVGDDAAAETIAGLGVDHAVVAAFYHATRALTPRHPRHRVVVAENSASYLPFGAAREY